MRPGRVDDPHISRRKRAAAPMADLVRVSQPIMLMGLPTVGETIESQARRTWFTKKAF